MLFRGLLADGCQGDICSDPIATVPSRGLLAHDIAGPPNSREAGSSRAEEAVEPTNDVVR